MCRDTRHVRLLAIAATNPASPQRYPKVGQDPRFEIPESAEANLFNRPATTARTRRIVDQVSLQPKFMKRPLSSLTFDEDRVVAIMSVLE